MKTFLTGMLILFSLTVLAQTAAEKPSVPQAVPMPSVEGEPAKKVDQKDADLDLIKDEKVVKDKSCKMVNGKMKCKKKRTHKKSVDQLESVDAK